MASTGHGWPWQSRKIPSHGRPACTLMNKKLVMVGGSTVVEMYLLMLQSLGRYSCRYQSHAHPSTEPCLTFLDLVCVADVSR
jgi:hypothetical protein